MHFLGSLFDRPHSQLALGARMHAIVAGRASTVFPEIMKRDGHKCHCCGVAIPGAMEIDALDGAHSNVDPGNLATICTFCHYARHPIWAASRGRLRMILAPDLAQSDICRIAWSCLFLEAQASGAHVAHDESALQRIYDDLDLREQAVEDVFGTSHPDALIEAIMASADKLGDERRQELIKYTVASLRYWPNTALTAWHAGMFRQVNPEICARAALDDGPVSDRIMKDARATAVEIADAIGSTASGSLQ